MHSFQNWIFSAVNFYNFWSSKPWIRIRSKIKKKKFVIKTLNPDRHWPKMLDPNPHFATLLAVLRFRIRDPVPFWHLDLDPGSGKGFFPDLGSRIPTPYFLELIAKFLGKKFYNSLKAGPNFFLQHLKNKIISNFVKFGATKKGLTTNFFSPLSFVAVFGSGIRDKHPGSATLVAGIGTQS